MFEPGEAWVGDWDTEEDDEVLDGLLRGKGGGHAGEYGGVCGWVVDLMAGTFGTGVDTEEGDFSAKMRVD